MKKTVKLLCALLAIIMVVGLFAGCQEGGGKTTTAPKGDGEKMKLTAVVQADARVDEFVNIKSDKYPVMKAFEDLLDKYNAFLMNGQGEQMKQWRTSLGYSCKEMGKYLGVATSNIVAWEKEEKMLKFPRQVLNRILKGWKNARICHGY